ncbi:hypothetical protein A0H81_07019 [Grifola frondosa]|uniref:Uncharacterized protein n=1 Tax=Grifola frondosa TaxID=5627 RepID=A0A1C7M8U3_GRIFR|nr:hypothetical protein A0H81_07019 [Grifola frondosa]
MKVLLQRMHQERTQLAQVQTEQPAGTTASSSAAAPQGDAARAQSRMPVERSKNAPFGSAEAHAEAQARAKAAA